MNSAEKVLEQRDFSSLFLHPYIERIVPNNSHPTMGDDGKKVSGMNVKKKTGRKITFESIIRLIQGAI